MSAKRKGRKGERIWRNSKLIVHLEIYRSSCLKVKDMIRSTKESYFSKHISNCNGNQNKLFNIVNPSNTGVLAKRSTMRSSL